MAAVVDAIPPAQDAHGVYRIGGTRVTLDLVVRGFQRGATAEEIVQLGRYANLSPSTGSFSVCEMSIGACIFPGPHSPGQLAGLRVPWS